VRDLVRTPLAIEVLDDLAHGRPPYARLDFTTVSAAVRCLESLGAAIVDPGPNPDKLPRVRITEAGRELHERLVQLTRSAVVLPSGGDVNPPSVTIQESIGGDSRTSGKA
jgi:hypothetical protein